MASKSTFEKKMERLDEITQILEKGEVPLEMLLKVYEEGVKLYRECHQILSETESKIETILVEEADKNEAF